MSYFCETFTGINSLNQESSKGQPIQEKPRITMRKLHLLIVLLSSITFLSPNNVFAQDLGVTAILSVEDYCNRQSDIVVTVNWTTFDGSTLTLPSDFVWELNGVAIAPETNGASIGASNGSFTFNEQIDFNDLNNGPNILKAYTEAAFDGNAANDTTTLEFNSWDLSSAGSVTNDSTACANNNGSTLNLDTRVGTIIEWQSNEGSSWGSIPTATDDTYDYLNLSQTTMFRVAVQSGYVDGIVQPGACPVVFSDFATITINPIPSPPILGNDSPVCEGLDLNLTAANVAGGSFSWTGPNGFTSTDQNPTRTSVALADAGDYFATVSVNGCESPQSSVTVVVRETPDSLHPMSNSPVCEGDTIFLTADADLVGMTYTWVGPDNFSSSVQNPSINNTQLASAGNYSVFGTANGCVGPTQSVNVAVNARPTQPTVTGTTPVCTGDSIELSAASDAGTTFTWTGPNGYTATGDAPVRQNIVAADAGTYYATAFLGGCPSQPGFTQITVRNTPATPAPTSNSPVCEGETLTLNTATVTGATYTWSADNGFAATGQAQNINNATAADAGTYAVLVTKDGCTSDSGFVIVNVNPIPATPSITTNSPVCTGNDLNLMTPMVAGATYNWTGPNNFSSNVQNPTITNVGFANAGNYTLFITNGGCSSDTETAFVEVNQTPNAPGITTNGPLCEGDDLNLQTSIVSGATYTWTGANGFTSSQQNPTKPSVVVADSGDYCVLVTVNGCPSPQSCEVVDVDPTPNAPIIAANSPICEGDTLFLTVTPVANASYAWTGPAGFASSQQDPFVPNVSQANAGDYHCVITVGNCMSPQSTVTVTVNNKPQTPSAGSNSPVCQGEAIMLSSVTVVGASYEWSGPNGYSSTQQNPQINGATSANQGFYFVKITANGCTSDSASTNVVVNGVPNAPSASSNSPVCEESTLELMTPTVTGAVYNWTGPNGFTSSLQNPTISNVQTAAAGTYEIEVTVNGCTSSPGQTNVIVNPKPAQPVASNTGPVCEGQDFTLMVNPVAGATYEWSGPNGFTSTLQNPTIVNADADNAGEYEVVIIVNGCRSDVGTTEVTVIVVGTPEAGSNSPLCEGEDLLLTATDVEGATYNWIGPNGFTSTDQNPTRPNTTVADAGTYGVYATIGTCVGMIAETEVVISPQTQGGMVVEDDTVCGGFNVGPLSLINSVGNVLQWEYSTNGGNNWTVESNQTTSNSYQDLTQTTMFRALVQSPGCAQEFSTSATITVIDKAEGGYIVPENPDVNYEVCVDGNEGTLTLLDFKGDIQNWEASTDEGETWENIFNPFDTYDFVDVDSTTWYRAIVMGCESMDTSEIYVLTVSAAACEGVVVANLITPNGDNKNDTWLIEDIQDYPPIDVSIYNRFGKELYQNSAYNNEWDATYQGQPLQDGTYYYIFRIEGNPKVFKGAINVLR